MGSILSALHHEKPIIVMPRRASLGEQRNEHQLATAKHMSRLGKIVVSFDEEDLFEKLDQLDQLSAKETIGKYAGSALVEGLSSYISNV